MLHGLRVAVPVAAIALLVGGCGRPTAEYAAGKPCDAGSFVVSDEFSGARRGTCEVFADQRVRIYIEPEDTGPINDSPWYAFRILPNGADAATMTLRYEGGHHRYWPKTSTDRVHWTRLDSSAVDVNWFRSAATITVPLDDGPVWVAAQEIVLPADVDAWVETLVSHAEVSASRLGLSANGLPIDKLDINAGAREVVFLTGRQHPPEVSGYFGFRGFYEAILAESDLAGRFRQRFHIVAIPMLNPDGVVAGNWRHNAHGTDLNRDWGPFAQPETKLIERLLEDYEQQGKEVRISVDFHSTASNLMYTQQDEDVTDPPGFTDAWIAAATARTPDYEFSKEPRPVSDNGTGRNYMYTRYGVPSVTFEVGDEEDRDIAVEAGGVFAEEMMRLLLDRAPAVSQHNRRL